jgi:uncharacterized phage protein (TIGR02218 family)
MPSLNGLVDINADNVNSTTIESKSNMSVDNMEIEGATLQSQITEYDLLAGLYDYATVEVFLVNYQDLTQGKLLLKRGHLGEVTLNKNMFHAEIRGLTQHLSQTIGSVYSPTCRAILGDKRCRVPLEKFTINAEVSQIFGNNSFYAKILQQDADYFTGGEVSWISGANSGIKMEVKEFANSVVTLALQMSKLISVGDIFSVVAGCDKVKNTCIHKFNNIINFRGEPDVPGTDRLLETAGTIGR